MARQKPSLNPRIAFIGDNRVARGNVDEFGYKPSKKYDSYIEVWERDFTTEKRPNFAFLGYELLKQRGYKFSSKYGWRKHETP